MSDSVAILTYHSISRRAGPTSISPEVFREQMEALAESGVAVVGLGWIERWLDGHESAIKRTVAITFDDAFQDFADSAHPTLREFGFNACVFVPTGLVGGDESWRGGDSPPRKLMDWRTIGDLARDGVEFGSHARTHRDLTILAPDALEEELSVSRRELEDATGGEIRWFAPPYGRSNNSVRAAVSGSYSLSFGVRLGETRRSSPRFDLPRIEMHYYRSAERWRVFLSGGDSLYFQARRAARAVRGAAERLPRLLNL